MGVVMDFREKLRHKQVVSERRALQDLSFSKIEEAVQRYFEKYLVQIPAAGAAGKEMCAEYALESFLLGSSMGRFGFYGEEKIDVFKRCKVEFYGLFDDFYDFWLFWGTDQPLLDDLQDASRNYLFHWWSEGYDASLKRWRLKLH
ncbi:DUF2521 family protein [Sporolactobacillus terrae]|uniref:DUF2521 domain-containing protein n=1 Tax=Sporolactobacillus terrae TaxID=269673 RepID=A0A410D5D3_9BACL|nr:DUF2521 family protein [Sporolactobacillus terrae]QAA21310.1 DUF2521 domain-containing protein [Sporolactobacillus terrae]QAA24282.1 DUF2521 domain-containing protein [Sporolactobacillus terrae]UAK16086.1 YbaK family protein [Sporolactobacillus terrae]BBN97524.1 hypothetical protein St703_02290 [Sporolactobacillus terrae]